MPPTKHTAGDVLRRHESRIRKLYQTNNIETVKRIMEEKGFPELAVSTWIERFGELGIRKNVSSDEWRIIYLHCLPWLEDPTRKKGDLKLKRTKQEIEIVVRGRTYSWNQAWKNMKSAGAIGQLPRPGESLGQLPPDIEIRTLPSVPLPILSTSVECVTQPGSGAIITTQAHDSSSRGRIYTSQQTSRRPSDNALSLIPVPSDHRSNRSNDWINDLKDCAERLWRYCIGLLPIGTVIARTVEIQNLAPPSGGVVLQTSRLEPMTVFATDILPDTFGDAEHGSVSELQCNLRDHFLSALLWPHATDLATITSHANYAMFFTVIYLLSNKFVDSSGPYLVRTDFHSGLFRKMDLIFTSVPIEYLEALIRSRLASIRAAYETLLLLTGYFEQQSAFQLLLEIGFRYDWIAIPIWGHQLLYFAVSMDLDDTLHTLLNNGCRPHLGSVHHFHGNREFSTAICEALRRGNLECMHLLLDCCDVNAPIHDRHGHQELSNFDCFLAEFNGNDEGLEYGLNAFIRAGASVEEAVVAPFDYDSLRVGIWNVDSWEKSPCEGATRLSVLDYLFYFHRRVFDAIASKSNWTPSRACILLSLESGIQDLQQHLEGIAQRVGQQRLLEFLKLMIAEQFVGCDLDRRKIATDLKTVRALLNCGVSITQVLHRFPDILDRFVRLIKNHSSENDMDAVQYLLENGAHVDGSTLSWLVRLPERRLFDLGLNQVGSSAYGQHIALVEVASRNDFQAVERLLHAGVDLGVDTTDPDGRPFPMSIIARFIQSSARNLVELPAMLEFLIIKGAALRLSKSRPQLHHLLHFVLHHAKHTAKIQETVRYIIRAGYKDTSFWPSSLLETCRHLKTFEQLFRHGVQLTPGSPLAHWIQIGGGTGLVREMLAAGASPHAYPRRSRYRRWTPLQAAAGMLRSDIVELLLDEGVDVNAAPEGLHGATALQAICLRRLEFTEPNEEKLKIIRLLLARGADVNAAPARRDGYTALQATAATGDLAAAKLLLLHRPIADVNAPPCQGQSAYDEITDLKYKSPELGTALDIAALYGRLDMVKLLLSCNALSHRRGVMGYDGAIFLAEKGRHFAVADLIREHAMHDQRLHLRNPCLSRPPRHWSEYGYKLDVDKDSECSSETDLAESDYTDDESVR